MKRVVMTTLFAGLLLGSCTTNNVASSGLIQKRKHNKDLLYQGLQIPPLYIVVIR